MQHHEHDVDTASLAVNNSIVDNVATCLDPSLPVVVLSDRAACQVFEDVDVMLLLLACLTAWHSCPLVTEQTFCQQ
jgi:hypothetical protein